jgi:hypothetical protein
MKTNFGITLHTTAEIFCVFCFLFFIFENTAEFKCLGNAKMEVLDATKKLNLIEENEPVQLDAVERQTEEVINESISSNYATDNGLKSLGNSTEEKVIQETHV